MKTTKNKKKKVLAFLLALVGVSTIMFLGCDPGNGPDGGDPPKVYSSYTAYVFTTIANWNDAKADPSLIPTKGIVNGTDTAITPTKTYAEYVAWMGSFSGGPTISPSSEPYVFFTSVVLGSTTYNAHILHE